MNGWLLVLTLANLALANAMVWFAIAQGWPKRLPRGPLMVSPSNHEPDP